MAADAKCFRKFSSVPAGSQSGSLSVCELQVNNFENFHCSQCFIEQFDRLFYRKVQWCYLDLVTSNLVTTSALVSYQFMYLIKALHFVTLGNLVTGFLEIKSVTK